MGEYSIVDLIEKLQEKLGYEGIIELLQDNVDSTNLKNIRYDEGDTPLCIAIKNTALWKKLSLKDENFIEKLDVDYDYIYSGPFDKTKQKVIGDSYLHMAARARNIDAFVFICKKNIALVTHKNDDGNNPFHEAARCRILSSVVKGIFKHIRSEAGGKERSEIERKIAKAREAKDEKGLENLAKELKNLDEEYVTKYIKDALQSKKYALNKNKETPLDGCCEKDEIKETVGIKDSFICNKKLHASLYVVGAVICVTALCLSLYFLFLANATFALSSIASMAVGGTAFLSLKACNEVFKLSEEGAISAVSVSENQGVC